MEDELLALSGLDQYIVLDDQDDFMTMLKQLIVDGITTHNMNKCIFLGRLLRGASQRAVNGLALWLKMMYEHWSEFGIDDDFYDYVNATLGLHRLTIKNYINVRKMLDVAPPDVVPQLEQQNIKALIPIANAIAQGEEISNHDWKQLAEAADYNSVAEIVREDIKGGKGGRKSRLTLMIVRDGTIYAYKGDERAFVGHLDVTSDSPIVEQARERIINNAGILEQ